MDNAANMIGMKETPMWADIVLTAKADGTKLLPLIVFKSAKQETAVLDKEIKYCCIAPSPNAWMNTKLTHTWVNKILGTF